MRKNCVVGCAVLTCGRAIDSATLFLLNFFFPQTSKDDLVRRLQSSVRTVPLRSRAEEQVGPRTCSSLRLAVNGAFHQGTCLKMPTRINRAKTNAVRTAQLSRDNHLFALSTAFVSTLICFPSSNSHFSDVRYVLALHRANAP